ncbi:MAG: gamma-glutamylcyclotransferase family protein, partial [Acidobacteriota bacterium]
GGYPAIVLDDNASSVIGEVYKVDDETLARLDEFELKANYPRMSIEISVDGDLKPCWIYGPHAELCAGRDQIRSGDWIEHTLQA